MATGKGAVVQLFVITRYIGDLANGARFRAVSDDREVIERYFTGIAYLSTSQDVLVLSMDNGADGYFDHGEGESGISDLRSSVKRKILRGLRSHIRHRNRAAQRPAENKIVMIGPDGEVEWEFLKARPVPGPEAALSVAGDGILKVSDTPYGRVSAVICFDADFPDQLVQAGILDVDILLVPSNDWRAITPWHAQMASYRGIEQGFQTVRPTSNGLSVAHDHQGRRLGALDYFRAEERSLIVQLPTAGVHTLHARIGGAFGWFCFVLLVLFTLAALRRLP